MVMAEKQKPRARVLLSPIVLLMIGGMVILAGMVFSSFSLPPSKEVLEANGVWVKAKTITSQSNVDKMLDRAEAGGFHVVFVNVFYEGQAYYDSSLAEKSDKVEPGFDPLAYLIPEAHRRGIEVHAWFMVGKVGDEKGSPILARHPDWALVGPDNEPTYWLNFSRPDVRGFVRDLMVETVEKYQVDGVHFDYTRYPGANWSFDPYSIQEFRQDTQIDLNRLRFADLPAYGFLEGNPLTNPVTAQVLAKFSNGVPAVTLNKYGEGEVLLINWDATERDIAAGGVILERGIRYLLDTGGEAALLRSVTNAGEYGFDSFEKVEKWLDYLGWTPAVTSEQDIAKLSANSVLILPNVYLITPATASILADFVSRGGGVIFIDGPTPSISLVPIQKITGLSARGKYFHMATMIVPFGEHPVIPTNSWDTDIETYQTWIAAWKEYRQEGINQMLQEIYRAIKSERRRVEVSMTITSDLKDAENRYMQDWSTWLKDKSIDFLIPRGYVDTPQQLTPILDAWHPAIDAYPGRIKMGLIAYIGSDQSDHAKQSTDLITEIKAVQSAGSSGFMIFSLDNMTDDLLHAVRTQFLSTP